MSLTETEISQALAEISPAVVGGRIQKIYQPTECTLVFEIRVPAHTYRVMVSCQPGAARIHFMTRSYPNPLCPFPFCQYLRAHIQGARIDAVCQVGDDRIVEWNLSTKEGPRIVMCELTGRKSNVLVLADGLVIRQLNREPVLRQQRYRPPEKKHRTQRDIVSSRFQRPYVDDVFPVSAAIELYYFQQDAALAVETAKDLRRRTLRKILKKDQRRIDAWREDLVKAARYVPYARYGELLKANLGSIKKGLDRITLVDYFDESMPEVTVPLDPTKSAQNNMDDYFRKHRKYVTAEQELRPRIEQAERNLSELHRELREIELGTWKPRADAARPRSLTNQRKGFEHQQGRTPFKRFTSMDGLQILVGRNARENEELTFGIARGDDLWLHARGAPGAHVVVRLDKGKDPPPGTLQEAAMLALLYSDLKKSGKGEVVYSRRKWIKKAKGQAPGTVVVAREQSLYVNLDKTALALLKEREAPKP